tara:strand:+ start:175 stop:519 length:345 start_codon:yes stop_codon:yes gene_type:complete
MPKKLDIDSHKVEILASFGCSTVEIAKFFGCDESTIRKNFKPELESGREQMKIKLRQLQWKHASLGNTALLIFLGKQYLGQSEKQEVDFSGNLETILKECGYVDNPIADAEKSS